MTRKLLAFAFFTLLASFARAGDFPLIPIIQKNITVLGDSISHGAFAIDIHRNLWVRILQSRINTGGSYGFVPLTSIGDGEKLSKDVASVRWVGGWVANPPDSLSASASPSGFSTRSQSRDSGVSITIPSFQSAVRIHWIQSPVGGVFRLHVDGRVVGEVDTSGSLGWRQRSFSLGLASGPTRSIYVEVMSDRPVDLVGASYLSRTVAAEVSNYSQSGRALVNVSRDVIEQVLAESSVMIMALGHNDQRQADRDERYFELYRQRIDWLISGARAHGVRVVVPDFCWTIPSTSRTRGELRRLAAETGGTYVDLPEKLSVSGGPVTADHLINGLGMWWDPSHPNIAGHRWVAGVMAAAISRINGQSLLYPIAGKPKSALWPGESFLSI